MDQAEISCIAHTHHPIAAPLRDARVRNLIRAALHGEAPAMLDLGCGRAGWLLEALELVDDARAVGVDVARPSLEEARREASRRCLADRLELIEGDAASWKAGDFDIVLSVGTSHVFGGLDGTLRKLRSHLRPGGRVVLGDSYWDQPPSGTAQEALSAGVDDLPDLGGVVRQVEQNGFEIIEGHVSTLEEWDEYEWSWTTSLIRWALGQEGDEDSRAEVLTVARRHRSEWLNGYRGQLGFVTLVLVDIEPLRAES